MVKKRIGVVADDVTGANDIGIMFAKNHYSTAVFPLKLVQQEMFMEETQGLDTIIIDTDSRFDDKELAAEKVRQATRLLMELGCDMYHNKTCSVFRGNIGAEFDAMQDVLGVTCSMVIAAFPGNGRTTLEGLHYVYGELLENSQFKEDPIHPMNTSSLKEIMQQQTKRKIANITVAELELGLAAVKDRMECLKKEYAYIIFDVRNQKDLQLVARAVKDEKNICGSSAIGEELPKVYEPCISQGGVLTVVGSLTKQSQSQITYMKERGYPVYEFHTDCIYDEEELNREMQTIVAKAVEAMSLRENVVIHTSNEKQQIKATKERGKQLRLTDEEIGKKISNSIFCMTECIMKQGQYSKLVVAGGDTSAAITAGLKIHKMLILQEIETGVPSMKASTKFGNIDLVLKSGSFGSESFLEKAAECLRKMR